jgi:hypothetical protein
MTNVVPCLLACLLGPHQCLAEEPLLLRVPANCACGVGRNILECYDPQPGDLVLFSYYKPLRNLIFFLAHSGGATHTALVVRRANGTLALLEAPGPKFPVMLSDLPSRFRAYQGRIWVRRLRTPLSPEQSARLTAFACAQEGKPFSGTAVLATLWGRPVRRPRMGCAGPEELDPPAWFCSSLTAAAGIAAGVIDPCVSRPKTTDPEDLKSDRCLDLSACWAQPLRYQHCGPRLPGWCSESCCGQRAYWEE